MTNTGGAERGFVIPPALPLMVLPGPALGPELVAAHDLGADAGSGELPPGLDMAERLLEGLVLTSTGPVCSIIEEACRSCHRQRAAKWRHFS